MELLTAYKQFLFSQRSLPSQVTVKNYISDVSRFLRWYEITFHQPFSPDKLHKGLIEQYEKDSVTSIIPQSATSPLQALSVRSFKRHRASLKKFFQYLELTYGIQLPSLFTLPTASTAPSEEDHLKAFKEYLYRGGASHHTIKNYLNDIRHFIIWLEAVSAPAADWKTPASFYSHIHTGVLEEYKQRLLSDAGFSPTSINRKLSSLRKFVAWAQTTGLIKSLIAIDLQSISNLHGEMITGFEDLKTLNNQSNQLYEISKNQELDNDNNSDQTPHNMQKYSSFAPLRLMQKMRTLITIMLDFVLISHIVKIISALQLGVWKITGKEIFQSFAKTPKATISQVAFDTAILNGVIRGQGIIATPENIANVHNISKTFFKPLDVSMKEAPFLKRLVHSMRHNRPNWYKEYHNYPIVHYFHFSILLLFIVGLGFLMYGTYKNAIPPYNSSIPLLTHSPPRRILAFSGSVSGNETLTTPAKIPLRFAIYSSPTASSSALLWQEATFVSVRADGSFKTNLGLDTTLPDYLFEGGQPLYLGVTVRNGQEMRPRQQLSTSSFAGNAARLDGMKTITSKDAGYKNVILALDSAGNLAIGGAEGTIFQATEGTITISGQSTLLTTVPGSNGDVQLAPDGFGRIDAQAPLFNSTDSGTLPETAGSVEINDALAILASNSATPALFLQNDSTGDLISASNSGTAKFRLDYAGNGTFAGDLAVNGSSLTTASQSFSIANSNVINLYIGHSATAVSIGAKTGITTINNDLLANGNVTLGNATNSALTIQGRVAKDSSITPLGTDGINNLGAASLPWDTLYVNTVAASGPLASTQGIYTGGGNGTLRLDADGSLVNITNASINGNVGIGVTASNSEKLQVLGDVRIGTTTSSGCLKRYDGTAIAGSCSSDLRLKKDITSLDNVLDKLTQLRPVTYFMRSEEFPGYNFGTSRTYGLIAQEVEQLFPDLVTTDKNGYKTVNYGIELTMLSLAGIRELATELRSMQPTENILLSNEGDISNLIQQSDTYDTLASNSEKKYSLITRATAYLRLASARITAGIIKAQEGAFDVLAIATENVTIAGKRLDAYILSVVNSQAALTSPLITAERLQTDVISPLSNDSEIAITLDDSKFTIRNGKTASAAAVATIDNQGNATFSGTLKADTIIANTIEGLDQKIATLAAIASPAATITNIYNVYTVIASPSANTAASSSAATTPPVASESAGLNVLDPSAQPINTASISAQFLPKPADLTSLTYADIGSMSGTFAYVPHMKTQFATVTDGLMVFGSTSLADVSVANQLSVGGNLILADNTINVLGATMELQPLRQGTISFMGGLMSLDTSGNLRLNGNAVFAKDLTVKGTLAANIIAPLPNSDITVQLEAKNQDVRQGSFVIQGASNSAVLSVNALGDVIASGTATLASLNIIRGASADTSSIETVASGSAGLGTITAGYTSRTIYSSFVTADSLIYLTPRTATLGTAPYLARQTPEDKENGIQGSFTVQISTPQAQDVEFNWWIVN